MRAKTNSRTIALAGKTSRLGRSFTSGLLFGLSAASLTLASRLPRPKMPKGDLASDWDAIGDDMRSALRKHVA